LWATVSGVAFINCNTKGKATGIWECRGVKET
jgi:hypothetical protein